MVFSRRLRWGVLAAFVALACSSARAQRPPRPDEGQFSSHVPGPRSKAFSCASAGDSPLSLARNAARLDLPGCDEPVAAGRDALARTPTPVAVPATPLLGPEAQGKKGQSISAARSRVLDVLSGENACSEWFRQGDRDPAGFFRTLSFAVDSKAVDYVIERMNNGQSEYFVNPYVATVVQDGGEYQTITLNAGGAFFRPSASLVRLAAEGGPVQFHGGRTLKVGPYLGSTPKAQLTTLLHELGHLLSLLPLDTNDANGLSAANTAEVLRHCQAEVESSAKRPSSSLSR